MAANIYKNKDGKRVPGVTTIIGGNLGWSKNGLIHWAWEQGINGLDYRASRDKAADTGTIAHAMVEKELKGEPYEWPGLAWQMGATDREQVEQAQNAYSEFVNWMDIVKFKLEASEQTLVSEHHQYGGQIDIAAIQGKRAIIDIKTSNAVYEDHKIQIAAYSNLWNENYPGEPIEAWYILQLGKEGGFTYHSLPEKVIDAGWMAFILLRELHDLKKILK